MNSFEDLDVYKECRELRNLIVGPSKKMLNGYISYLKKAKESTT